MEDEFYIRFEDKFRGSRLTIKDRLRVYLPIIEPLKAIYPDNSLIDLGCGRGEWLELLQENGWKSVGVDTNSSMVNFCQGLGFNAFLGDAIAYLHSMTSESISVVSGFHIAEHLPFELLLELIKEAHRTLLPGGFLILETPNPENITVGTSSFYFDPTHLNPIPLELLSFLSEYYGFYLTKTLRLQESPELLASKNTDLLSVLSGVSPDYAIIAQKDAKPEILATFNNELTNEYGLTLETLAQRYDYQANAKFQHFSSELGDIQAEVDRLKLGLDEVRADYKVMQEHVRKTEDERDIAQADLLHVYNSRSYRITAPMRAVFGAARKWRDRLTHPKQLNNSNLETAPQNEQFSLKPQDIQEMNLDEIMERIREEVARSKIPSQYIDDFNGSNLKETVLFRLVKKLQLMLKKLPFYKQIFSTAIKFKTLIPKYQQQQLRVDDLLKYEDEDFIKNAYKAILKREPDNDGYEHFLSKLTSGSLNKAQILGRLRYSSEGKRTGARIKGLLIKYITSSVLRNDRR